MANKSNAPEGFNTDIGRRDGDGWLTKEVGVTVCGRLLGRQEMKGQKNQDGSPRAFYQVQLDSRSGTYKAGKRVGGIPATMKEEDDEEPQKLTLEPGKILNIGEHAALRDLAPFTTDGGVYDVWFEYTGKKDTGKPSPMWDVDGPKLNTLRKGTAQTAIGQGIPTSPSNGEAPKSEIPY